MPKATLLKFGTLRHLCSFVNLNIFSEQILLRQPTECCFYRGSKLSKILSITKCLESLVYFFHYYALPQYHYYLEKLS